GHALAHGDFDGDGDDEIIAGYRGKGYRIYMYDSSQETQKWKRQEIADHIALQGVAVGDMNGDKKLDFVAAGGRTHNVAVFLNRMGG
ncbi:hypothetical protein GF373_15080, partial [bacterium]|nr:hypothetical protein [bacterium]